MIRHGECPVDSVHDAWQRYVSGVLSAGCTSTAVASTLCFVQSIARGLAVLQWCQPCHKLSHQLWLSMRRATAVIQVGFILAFLGIYVFAQWKFDFSHR